MYWFSVTPLSNAEEGTDRWAVEQRWISMTPLNLDMTDKDCLARYRQEYPLDEALAAATSPPQSSPEAAKAVEAEEASAATGTQTP